MRLILLLLLASCLSLGAAAWSGPSVVPHSEASLEGRRGPPFCRGDEAWKRCVGNTRPCACYETACGSRDTVEKRVLEEYNDLILDRQYDRAYLIFADDFVTNVPSFGISIAGKDANVAYLLLGDPDVSDSYEIVNSTIISSAQEGRLVNALVAVRFRNVRNNDTFPTTVAWSATFDARRRMASITILPDTLALQVRLGNTLDLNVTSVCAHIQADCTGDLQQYPSLAACVSFMSGIALSIPGLVGTGNTVACRSWHEVLARASPAIHCPHTGPLNNGPFATPCN